MMGKKHRSDQTARYSPKSGTSYTASKIQTPTITADLEKTLTGKVKRGWKKTKKTITRRPSGVTVIRKSKSRAKKATR